ncbi:MAG: DUF5330 domain-containing protein [Pseudomonadota bacterium]
MIRLIIAIGLASALWPIDENNEMLSVSGVEISSTDLLSAAHSVYQDVGGFCERNTETCITGQQIFYSVKSTVQSRLQSEAAPEQPQPGEPSS